MCALFVSFVETRSVTKVSYKLYRVINCMSYIKLSALLIFSVCAAIGSFVHGQDLSLGENSKSSTSNKNKSINRNAMTDGISGLLIDNMITPNGHQFFQLFSSNWQENPESENFSLTFVETTSRLRGSQILIYSGTRLMFNSGLPYKSSQLRPVVDQAIEAINSGINSLATETGSADKDLGEEEL
ncbi:MAG: hypothetical protein EBU92_11880 [Betaproteobacteria bacterium]|nr:hypothetical protein [Betaproteobacteria bacterium]